MNYTNVEDLIHLAEVAKANAHCPYSNFPVGAALVTESGHVYTGCNVENACFPVGVCAERTAIGKAVSEGYKTFTAIAIITDKEKRVRPCGMCRQTLREFCKDITIYCASNDRSYEVTKLSTIFPESFGGEDLESV